MSQLDTRETAHSPLDINNPYQVLCSKAPVLVRDAIDGNDNIGEFLYKVFAGIANDAMVEKHDPRKIKTFVGSIGNDRIKIWVDFGPGSESLELKILFHRNAQIAHLMTVNNNVLSLAERLILIIHKWAAQKRIPISAVVIKDVKMEQSGNSIIATLQKRDDFDYQMGGKIIGIEEKREIEEAYAEKQKQTKGDSQVGYSGETK